MARNHYTAAFKTKIVLEVLREERSLKTELIYISEFRSPRELRTAIRDYIHQYNRIRPHQSLDYAVPDDVFYSGLAA